MPDRIRYACEWTTSGIAVAAQRCLRALDDAGADVAWEPLVDEPSVGRDRAADSSAAPSWMRALRRPESPDEVVVVHSVPGSWSRVAGQLSARHRIGHAVWELDDVPVAWRIDMADVDEFWVPTEWNRRAFERAFNKPVHVVPHVVTAVEPSSPPIEVPDDVAVVSLISSWDWRKRPDRAIEAFCRAFGPDDDVVLVVKTSTWVHGWPGTPSSVQQAVAAIVARFPESPPIIIDTRVWTDAQVQGLVQRSACTLSLAASEGWSLSTFDAAALGVPSVITGYGGHVEYLGSDYPGLIPYAMAKTYHHDRTLFERGTEWAHADLDAAIDLVRGVVFGSAREHIARAAELAPEIRRRYAPEAVASVALDAAPARVHPQSTNVAAIQSAEPSTPDVVVLTPLKDSAHRAGSYVDRILALDYPPEHLSVAVLVSDSNDGTADAFRAEFERLGSAGIGWSVFEHDFGYRMPADVPRWDPAHQLDRRTVLAKSRNHLLLRGLGDAEWALWLDGDVIEFPDDVIQRLLDVGEDVVHPNCVVEDGHSFDLNAWTDQGRYFLDDYVGTERVELHAVGGTMLLVNADRHRDGLTWPAYRHGIVNPRARTDPERIGRPELGEVETEGLGILAYDMGIACWGLPDLKIWHEE